MSTRSTSEQSDPVIESRDDLLAPMIGGEKPKASWRIGTEHEKFVYHRDTHQAPSYAEDGGIRDLLLALEKYGWKPVEEIGPDGTKNVIAACRQRWPYYPRLQQPCHRQRRGKYLRQVCLCL